ncbi:MAG: cellulase family glycosylhydrolase [Myxococcota bacterium]
MRWLLPWVLVAACAGSLAPATPQTTASEDRSAAVAVYWDHPRAGTNMFRSFPSVRRFRAARDAGIRMVRLVPDPWQGLERDFLIGDADDYQGLVAGDLQRLRTVLDLAHHAGLRVVLAMLSLPGARWRQHNDDANDVRLWADPSYAEQAARFWGDLSRELSRHPAIVAYNPINEPRADDPTQIRTVYARIVQAIRRSDPQVPIVLDVGRDAAPQSIDGFEPFDDAGVLYAFHLYEPWEHVTWRVNQGRVPYGS